MARSFQQLHVWKEGVELYIACEKLAIELDAAHRFGLSSQVRRSALSIPSNIAEGAEGGTDGIYLRHIRIAIGSAAELRTQVICVHKIGLIDLEKCEELERQIDKVAFPLYKLRGYLKKAIVSDKHR